MNKLPVETRISAGVHPWHASEWTVEHLSQLERILQHKRVDFIGEIGLDNVCMVPFQNQLPVFEFQLQMAERMGKSVLIHNVGHLTELLALKNKFKSIPAWILHGFRGKAAMVEQYVRNGFHLSFGDKYQIDALRACPIDHLFLETDNSKIDLNFLYKKIASDLEVSEKILIDSISKNGKALGIN